MVFGKVREQRLILVSDVRDPQEVMNQDQFEEEERCWIRVFHYMATTPVKSLKKQKLNWKEWAQRSNDETKTKREPKEKEKPEKKDVENPKESKSDASSISKWGVAKDETNDIEFSWPQTFDTKEMPEKKRTDFLNTNPNDSSPKTKTSSLPIPFKANDLNNARDGLIQIPSGKAVSQLPSLKDSLQQNSFHQSHEVQKAKQEYMGNKTMDIKATDFSINGAFDYLGGSKDIMNSKGSQTSVLNDTSGNSYFPPHKTVTYDWNIKSFPSSPDLLPTQPLLNHSLNGPSKDFHSGMREKPLMQ